jgi:flagellar biosynthesis protein
MTKRQRENQRAQAVALQYNQQDQVPRIVASGSGEIAKQILELARENNIPIKQDEALTDMLAQISVGSYIPPESFRLVAEIISFLYLSDREWREAHPELAPILERKEK